jgi:predicted DNA-binding transcriptional regulator AlpA
MGTKLTRAQVADRYHVSVRTILRWTDDPDYRDLNFPKSVKLGFRNTLYDLNELEEWEKERAAAPPPKVRKKPKATISDLTDLEIDSGVAA